MATETDVTISEEALRASIHFKHGDQGFNLDTGELTETHCMCLTLTLNDKVYDACCKCWFETKELFAIVNRNQTRLLKRGLTQISARR